jgi:Family of unknown function (DUF6893)
MMMNGTSRLSHKRVSIASRVMVGLATIAAGIVLIRALPDIIRYMRVRRM